MLQPETLLIGGLVIVSILVVFIVWYVPKRQVSKLMKIRKERKQSDFEREKERIKLEDDTRKTLAQIVGGVFLIGGVFFTYNTYRLGLEQQKVSIQKQDLDRRGQITDRFNKAVTNLGSQDLSVRLGGLYALEQILKDSPEEHQTIIEILSAYIREKAKIKKENPEINQEKNTQSNPAFSTPKQNDSIPTDIQTALTILGRRNTNNDRLHSKRTTFESMDFVIDLTNSNLSGANLSELDFQLTDFSGSKLSNVNFRGTNFSFKKITGKDLEFSNFNYPQTKFINADLTNSDLFRANLFGVDFSRANLTGVNFANSNLYATVFNTANLSNAKLLKAIDYDFSYSNIPETIKYTGISLEQLKEAIVNEETTLPEKLESNRQELLLISTVNSKK